MGSTKALGILLALMLIPGLAVADTNQRLGDGEIIVTTEDEGDHDIPRVNVYGVIDAPPEDVWALVSDCDRYVGVLPRTDKAEIVERSGSTVICDVTIDLPFPLSDLQATTRATHTVGPPAWKREWELIEGDYEINSGSWRLRNFQGDDERTLVIYSIHAVPNTRIPESIRNRAQKRSMPGVIEALREELVD